MPEYVITVRVPFTFNADPPSEKSLIVVGLAHVLDSIAEYGGEGIPDDVTVKIKKKARGRT
jgi:hypothetical protein